MRGQFIGKLDVTPLGRSDWQLDRPFGYRTSDGETVKVPAGFVTDFASVPRFLPIAYSLCGDTAHKAAVIHDYLYRMTNKDRRRCDWIFRDAMQADGVPGWRRWLMWSGVRIGGWLARKKVDGFIDGKPVIIPQYEKGAGNEG